MTTAPDPTDAIAEVAEPPTRCAECGSTERVRCVMPMMGWGNGFSGFGRPVKWCMKCCKRHRGHYKLLYEITERRARRAKEEGQ